MGEEGGEQCAGVCASLAVRRPASHDLPRARQIFDRLDIRDTSGFAALRLVSVL